ncbi:MAG: hypothetical protein KF852_09480 [Saprospiraceae bacterium]|nr:hypothetical protein [Saprospiraceae bacterium]
MKRLFITICMLFTGLFAYAQGVPPGINYQAVARDAKGAPLVNHAIALKISLLAGDASGKSAYEEIHRLTTNELGLFSLVIGQGAAAKGDFTRVPWSEHQIWMEIALDETGGDLFHTVSATQLMAVPYAFHAGSAGTVYYEQEDAEKLRCSATGIPFWGNRGNFNVNDTCHFIGTTVPVDFIFKTDNMERMRITKDGDLIILSRVTFEENVQFNGDSVIVANDLFVGGSTDIGEDLGVGGNGSIAGDLTVDGDGRFTNIFVSNNAEIGNDLTVERDASISRDLAVERNTLLDGTLTVNNRSGLNGQVTINANVAGGDASYNAYPLRVEGSAQGIAVKVNAGTPDNSNNFITFFDSGNTARGRIEGQTAGEVASTPEFIFETSILTAEVVAAGVNIGLSALPNACAGVGAVACPPEPSVVAIAIAEEILAIANLAAYEAFAFTNLGVTYQSGSADYAEWLERQNLDEGMSPGDIVGVNGGKISKRTVGASQFLVISTNPAVLGNMPADGEADRFEKVAFMGQIPVKMRGPVNVGDYILPSGLNDGTGIAVAPGNLTPKQYSQIVGVAWSAAPAGSKLAFVNMAIGLNTNDMARLVEEQQNRIESLEKEVSAVKSDFAALSRRLDALESGRPVQPTVAPQPKQAEYIAASVPATLDAAQIEEAILLLEDTYRAKGLDVESHAGLKKLFRDADYRQDIIRGVQGNYAATRSNILHLEARRN